MTTARCRGSLARLALLLVVAIAGCAGCGRNNPQREAGTIQMPAPSNAPGAQKDAPAAAKPAP